MLIPLIGRIMVLAFNSSFMILTAECTPEEAFSIVGDNIIYASGSPFKDVDLGMYQDNWE